MAQLKGKWVGTITVSMVADIDETKQGMIDRYCNAYRREKFEEVITETIKEECSGIKDCKGMKIIVSVNPLCTSFYGEV